MVPTFELVSGAPDADLFVVPVFSGARLGPGAQLVDDPSDRALLVQRRHDRHAAKLPQAGVDVRRRRDRDGFAHRAEGSVRGRHEPPATRPRRGR